MAQKSFFRIGLFALAGFVSISATPATAAGAAGASTRTTAAKATTKTAAKKPAARSTASRSATPPAPSTRYSAARAQTRRTTLAQARAVAMAREVAQTVLPRYKTDANGEVVPDLRAAAAIIYDPETKQVLWEENSQSQRSIASITKVMTATVFLENNPDLTQPVTIVRSDVFQASTTHLRNNDKLTTDDLLHLLLIASDNAAARALARVYPGGTEAFVARMNQKAIELGLESTSYVDPSGLLSDNMSSAYDLAQLITLASGDERIASIMRTPEYTVWTAAHRNITFHSTNHLLGRSDVDVRAGKTGFISKSGYCLATLLRLPEGGQFAVVVLGARSNAGRFLETRNLFDWISTKASTLFSASHKPAAEPQLTQIP